MSTTKRIPELDSLRGFAAVAVVLFHYFYNYDKHYGHNFAISGLFELGQAGVHLFFIISGFVIYWTLIKSENIFQFAWSRFSRLYPVYWAAVFISFTSTLLIGPPDRTVGVTDALLNLTMFHEYVGIAHVDRVYWTLSIELAFYILVGSALFLGLTKYTFQICLLWITLALITRLFNLHLGLIHKALILNWCHLFIAGIMFYLIWSKSTNIKIAYTILALSAVTSYISNSGFTCILVLSFYLLFPLAIFGKMQFLNHSVLIWFGKISYPLYLVHQNIGYGIIMQFYAKEISPVISIPVAILFSIFIAFLLNKYVETPSMKALRNYAKRSHD